MDEHRPGESEQTLDPELLSNLFERLITPTEEGRAPPLRQPQGTYYTPADVADEMVKDALSAAVRDAASDAVSNAQLLELFGAADAPLPPLTPDEQTRLAARIRELRIFDPAVGSGEFLFSALLALQRALGKLEASSDAAVNPGVDNANDDNLADDISAAGIIRRQLAGQDIHPLAVQIARLRLFIAITAARVHQPGTAPVNAPLPNLEARIVCADTLATVADPQWRPDQPGRLDTADPELIAALTAVAANRAQWFDAHTEERKQELLAADQERRDRLTQLLSGMGDLATPELSEFAKTPLFNINPTPAATDARLLFYENPWRGFDVVISNPPYEGLSKSMTRKQIDALKTDKGYQTTNVGDLYSLFCETALSLVKPDGGVVTLVVPLSVSFGHQQMSIRSKFNEGCREIALRHYDIRPDTIFNSSPTVKTPSNSQRATVLTAVVGESRHTTVKTTGLQRWPSDERGRCLLQRNASIMPALPGNVDERIAGQWARIPTPEVAEMVQTILRQENTIGSYGRDDGVNPAFPVTARYFVSALPAGAVAPRRENNLTVADADTLRLMMAVQNGHIGYCWWWMFGDGFDVKLSDFTELTIPDAWAANPQPAIAMGQRLIDAMP